MGLIKKIVSQASVYIYIYYCFLNHFLVLQQTADLIGVLRNVKFRNWWFFYRKVGWHQLWKHGYLGEKVIDCFIFRTVFVEVSVFPVGWLSEGAVTDRLACINSHWDNLSGFKIGSYPGWWWFSWLERHPYTKKVAGSILVRVPRGGS